MVGGTHLSIGEVARLYRVPQWRARRVVDAIEPNLPRCGLYRLVPRELLKQIEAELQRPQSRRRERRPAAGCRTVLQEVVER